MDFGADSGIFKALTVEGTVEEASANGQSGAHEAVAQPHAVRAGLLPGDPGTGVRRS